MNQRSSLAFLNVFTPFYLNQIGLTMTSISGQVSSQIINGELIRFFVADQHDAIQYYHSIGEFYEPEELSIISEFFPRGGVYVDIGSNVGNHVIYAGKFLRPSQVIVFEPNPPSIVILEINLALNGLLPLVDMTYLGVGVSDRPGMARAHVPEHNLGATQLADSDNPEGIPLLQGDQALQNRRVDFIKMDVEGMEIRALAGLAATIAKWRPSMFIEVDNVNSDAFDAWLAANHYVVARSFRRYPQNINHLVVPIEKAATPPV